MVWGPVISHIFNAKFSALDTGIFYAIIILVVILPTVPQGYLEDLRDLSTWSLRVNINLMAHNYQYCDWWDLGAGTAFTSAFFEILLCCHKITVISFSTGIATDIPFEMMQCNLEILFRREAREAFEMILSCHKPDQKFKNDLILPI